MSQLSEIKITIGADVKNKKEFIIYMLDLKRYNIIKSTKYFQAIENLMNNLSNYQEFDDLIIEDFKNIHPESVMEDYSFFKAQSTIGNLDFGVLFKRIMNYNHLAVGLWPKEFYDATIKNSEILDGFLLKILNESAFFKVVEIHKPFKEINKTKHMVREAIKYEICPFCKAPLSLARIENLKRGNDTFCPKCLKVILP